MITCSMSLSGLIKLKIGSTNSLGGAINFPIIPTYDLSTGKIKVIENSTSMTIGGINIPVIELSSDFNSLTEELTIDDAGRYYTKTFNLNSIYDSNLQTLLENKYVVIFAQDSNYRKWVMGYDNPMKLMTYTLNSGVRGDGQDTYNLIYSSFSYNQIKQYQTT